MGASSASAMDNVAKNGQASPVAVVKGGTLVVPTLLGLSLIHISEPTRPY